MCSPPLGGAQIPRNPPPHRHDVAQRWGGGAVTASPPRLCTAHQDQTRPFIPRQPVGYCSGFTSSPALGHSRPPGQPMVRSGAATVRRGEGVDRETITRAPPASGAFPFQRRLRAPPLRPREDAPAVTGQDGRDTVAASHLLQHTPPTRYARNTQAPPRKKRVEARGVGFQTRPAFREREIPGAAHPAPWPVRAGGGRRLHTRKTREPE